MTDAHTGELRESAYGFQCWVRCSCGWRSRSYQDSQLAWIAHAAHVDIRTEETATVLPRKPHG